MQACDIFQSFPCKVSQGSTQNSPRLAWALRLPASAVILRRAGAHWAAELDISAVTKRGIFMYWGRGGFISPACSIWGLRHLLKYMPGNKLVKSSKGFWGFIHSVRRSYTEGNSAVYSELCRRAIKQGSQWSAHSALEMRGKLPSEIPGNGQTDSTGWSSWHFC